MNYREWIMKHRESVVKTVQVYSVVNENKEVRVHNIGDQIFIRFLIDGKEIEDSQFPPEIAMQIQNYLRGFYFQEVTEEVLVGIADYIGKFLPDLKDPKQEDFKDWKLIVHTGEME